MEPNQSDASFVAPQQAMPPVAPLAPAPQPPVPVSGQAQIAVPINGAPVLADDADIIEADWVLAIKRTLEQYKHDPYLLSQAMTALRQDYLQKRYGKTVEAAK